MKLKYQLGGVVYTPSSPVEYSGQAVPEKQQTQKQEKSFLQAPELKELLGKGLDNDTTAYINKINSLYNQYDNMSESERKMPHGRAIAAEISGNFAEMQSLNRRLEHFNKSYDLAKANDGLLADAVTSDGFVVKRGDIVATVSFDKYAADRASGKVDYEILSNEQLAREREFNPALTNNTSVFNIIANSRGISKIKEDIMKTAANATGEHSQQLINEGLLTKQQAEAMDSLIGGIQGGLYKSYSDIEQSNNSSQLELALSTLAQTLDTPSINTIKAQLYKTGSTPESLNQDFNDFLISLVMPKSKISDKKTQKISLEGTIEGKSGEGKGGTDKVGLLEAVAYGRGDMADLGFMSKGAAKIEGIGSMLPKSASVSETGEPVSLAKSQIRDIGIIDQAFTYDGNKVDPSRTVLTGTQYVAKMPVRRNRITGEYEIDQEGSAAFAEYNKKLKREGLNKPDEQMTMAEREMKKAIDHEFKASNRYLELKDFIISEAISAKQGDEFYWFDEWKDKPDIYKKATGEETDKLKKAIGKDHPAWSGIEETTWSHLVFIPAHGGMYFRAADDNQLNTPKATTEFGAYTEARGSRNMPTGNIRFFNQ